jgi:hypothetical protein
VLPARITAAKTTQMMKRPPPKVALSRWKKRWIFRGGYLEVDI